MRAKNAGLDSSVLLGRKQAQGHNASRPTAKRLRLGSSYDCEQILTERACGHTFITRTCCGLPKECALRLKLRFGQPCKLELCIGKENRHFTPKSGCGKPVGQLTAERHLCGDCNCAANSDLQRIEPISAKQTKIARSIINP